MATFEQIPGELNLSLVQGDEFPFSASFNVNLTGYTLQSSLYNGNSGASLATPTMTMTTATVGGVTTSTVEFLLNETQTAALTVNRMRWYFRWVSPAGVTRTVLAGTVKAVKA